MNAVEWPARQLSFLILASLPAPSYTNTHFGDGADA